MTISDVARGATFALLASTICGGCESPPTELVVVVDSDLRVPGELDAVRIDVRGPEEQMANRSTSLDPEDMDARSLPLVLPVVAGGGELEPVTIEVRGLADETEILRRTVETGFVRGQARVVHIVLVRACFEAEPCPEGQSCGAGGECVDNAVPADSLDEWPGQRPDKVELDVPAVGEMLDGLVAGGEHGCVRDGEGQMFCWGANGSGQLGDGTDDTRRIAQWVPIPAGVDAMAAGDSHTCAVSEGSVSCWGNDANGQLGNGDTEGAAQLPTEVAGLSEVVDVTAGNNHTCAIRDAGGGGRLHCWGRAADGQLGPLATGDAQTTPVEVSLDCGGSACDVQDVAAGTAHTCAVAASGQVFCWGSNGAGQLGTIGEGGAMPAAVEGLENIVAVTAGTLHTCAVDAAGAAYCWGSDNSDQLGLGDVGASESTPMRVMLEDEVDSIAAGDSHTCAADGTDTVWCWGRNESGELGRRDVSETEGTPGPVEMLSARAVAAGTAFSCAVTADGAAVQCWGSNARGRLGNPAEVEFSSCPIEVRLDPDAEPSSEPCGEGG